MRTDGDETSNHQATFRDPLTRGVTARRKRSLTIHWFRRLGVWPALFLLGVAIVFVVLWRGKSSSPMRA